MKKLFLASSFAMLIGAAHILLAIKGRLREDDHVTTGVMKMKIFIFVLASAFLTATIASSFSSDAYAARRGTMSGVDNTYGSQKGQKCMGGACTPAGAKKGKKQQ
jgi:hypothetical protein